MNEIRRIKTLEVTEFGHKLHVIGRWNGRAFSINLDVEFDSRDVESEPAGNVLKFDPLETDDFFDKLCEDPRFVELHKVAYKMWEEQYC